jgi:hypothetical protein
MNTVLSTGTILIRKSKYISTFAAATASYFKILDNIVKSDSGFIAAQTNVDMLAALKFTVPDSLETYYALFDEFELVESAIYSIRPYLTNPNYIKTMLYSMSMTFTTNMYKERDVALFNANAYMSQSADMDKIILSYVFHTYKDKCKEFIRRHEENPNKMAIYIMGKLGKGYTEAIESRKDALLGSSTIDVSDTVYNLLGRGNFAPSRSMKPKKLVALIDPAFAYDEAKSFAQNAKELTNDAAFGICLISNPQPISAEFNLDPLVNGPFIDKYGLAVSQSSGLTKKVIPRYSTLFTVAGTRPESPSLRRFGSKSSEEWIIVETFNDVLYRLIGRSPTVGKLSLRPQRYNEIQAETILEKYREKRASYIYDLYKREVQAEFTMNILVAVKNDLIDEIIAKLGGKVRENNYIAAIIRDSPIINNKLHAKFITKNSSTNFEYMLPIILKLDTSVRAFVRILMKYWREVPDKSKMQKEDYLVAISGALNEVFEKTINDAKKMGLFNENLVSLKNFFMDYVAR